MTKNTKSVLLFVGFLVVNFGALGLGVYLMNGVPTSDWYQNQLNRAPWEPPGRFFGVAWTTIMILFSIYMTYWWNSGVGKKKIISLYITQLILNVLWNPVFFGNKEFLFGLIIISSLSLVMGYFFFGNWKTLKTKSFLVLPYFVWLLVATSLNLYIVLMN